MTLSQHVLKNYTKVHYPVMTASLFFFYTFTAMKKAVVNSVIGQSSPMNAYLYDISYVCILKC